MKIGVIGPAGFGGSYLCVELIERGHEVFGISRDPKKLGQHELYTPRPADVNALSIVELSQVFRGLDVVVNEYGPHSAGHEALQYSKQAEVQYSRRQSVTNPPSAISRSHAKDYTRHQTRKRRLFHHGWRLWKLTYAGLNR